jgi:hypothetical protein
MKTAVFSFAIVLFGMSAFTQTQDLVFTSVTPCVAFDTRPAFGGPGKFAPEQERSFHIVGSTANFAAQGGNPGGCNVPGFAGEEPVVQAVFINYVAVDPEGGGTVKAWPGDESEPAQGAMVNFQALTPPMNNSNGVVTGVRQDEQGADIRVKAKTSAVHVRGVILGYFTKDHQHSGEDITTGTVAEARIDSAIARDSEVLTTVLANDGTGSNLDADRLDGLDSTAFAPTAHNHDATYEKRYVRTIIVRSGGTPSENGTALRTALASITGNTATNTYLLKLEPGIYDVGFDRLAMKPWVDIEGSGQLTTTITGPGNADGATGTVSGSSNAEIRSLTIQSVTSGETFSTALANVNQSPRVTDVTIEATRSGPGISRGVYNSGASPVFRNLTVRSTADTGGAVGVFSESSSHITFTNVDVIANANGTVGLVQSEGSLIFLGGTIRVSSNNDATGVNASSTLLDIMNVKILSAGDTQNFGFRMFTGTDLKLSSSRVNVTGTHPAFACYGIQAVEGSTTTMTNTEIDARGCVTNWGLDLGGDEDLIPVTEIQSSTITASDSTISARSGAFASASNSKLKGGPTSGAVTCAGVVDDAMVFYAGPGCP